MIELSKNDLDYIVDKVIERMKPSKNKRIEILIKEDEIIQRVSEYTGISRHEMTQRRRIYEHIRARFMVFIELMRELGYSQGEAAAVFNYDHATALYAERKLTGGEYQSTQYYKKFLKWKNIS